MAVGKLYMIDLSPPVRAVLLTEKALGITLEHKELNLLGGEHLKADYVKVCNQKYLNICIINIINVFHD